MTKFTDIGVETHGHVGLIEIRKPPLNFDVVPRQKDVSPSDPSLVHYPLIYLHGRAEFDLVASRRQPDRAE